MMSKVPCYHDSKDPALCCLTDVNPAFAVAHCTTGHFCHVHWLVGSKKQELAQCMEQLAMHLVSNKGFEFSRPHSGYPHTVEQ